MVDRGEKVVITRRGHKAYRLDRYVEDDLRERDLDWACAIEDVQNSLSHLPKFDDSIVDIMRAEERY